MDRRALLVGINVYDYTTNLKGCIDDVNELKAVLEMHENQDRNFDCRVLLGSSTTTDALLDPSSHERVTFNRLKKAIKFLLDFDDMVLFYFSGHGFVKEGSGVYLVAQDGTGSLPGVALNEILELVNNSRAREVILLIDSCHSGGFAEPEQGSAITNFYLRPGVTLLAASRSDEVALERNGRGLFTSLLIGALKGGASDVRGRVSAASIYAYVEQALGVWEQRPIYKSNAVRLSPIRYCKPHVVDAELRLLPQLFSAPDAPYLLDPSYEFSFPEHIPENYTIFKRLKHYQVAGLVRPILEDDLYFTAKYSHAVELTPLGQFYWRLARDKLI